MATISEVKSIITGKSRANRFQVIIPSPEGVINDVLVRAATFPGKTASAIEVPYRGVKFKVAGDPTQNEWSIEVLAEDYETYRQFYAWFDRGANIIDNTRGNPADYKVDGVIVSQLDNKNQVVASMTLNGVWVLDIEDVSFNQETDNQMITFGARLSIDNTTFNK